MDSFPNRVGDHVRPGGQRRRGTGQGPADLVQGQGKAFFKWEEDGVEELGRLAGEKSDCVGPGAAPTAYWRLEAPGNEVEGGRWLAFWPSIQSGQWLRPGRTSSVPSSPS